MEPLDMSYRSTVEIGSVLVLLSFKDHIVDSSR